MFNNTTEDIKKLFLKGVDKVKKGGVLSIVAIALSYSAYNGAISSIQDPDSIIGTALSSIISSDMKTSLIKSGLEDSVKDTQKFVNSDRIKVSGSYLEVFGTMFSSPNKTKIMEQVFSEELKKVSTTKGNLGKLYEKLSDEKKLEFNDALTDIHIIHPHGKNQSRTKYKAEINTNLICAVLNITKSDMLKSTEITKNKISKLDNSLEHSNEIVVQGRSQYKSL